MRPPADKSKPKVKIRALGAAPLDARPGAILALVSAVALLGRLGGALQQSSELSLEYLDLRRVPSDQLCGLQARNNQTVNSLSLASNRIERIEASAFVCVAPRLRILSLRNNQIETIADGALKGLVQLEVLLLDGNQLKRLPSRQLAASSLPSLRHLNLAHNQISSIESADSLTGPNLISLNLRRNPLELLEAKALSGLTHLRTLILSECKLKTNHFGLLEGLTELSFVHLDELGAHLNSIDEQFCHSSRKLATLSLKWNQFESVPRFTSCQGLLSLDLSYNRIQGRLEGNFSQLTNLIDLYLGHNRLEYLGPGAFVGLSRLQVLELNSNKIKQIHPAAFVPLRETLLELDVAHNVQLAELAADGLERLASLKAHGNMQLRRLPSELPSIRLLALTFAYHCCDYDHTNQDAGNWSESRPIGAVAGGGADPVGVGLVAGHHHGVGHGDDGVAQQRPGRSLVARWSESFIAKLAQLWRRDELNDQTGPAPPEATANPRNISELLIWAPATVRPARGGRQRREQAMPVAGFNLGGDDPSHQDDYSGPLNLHRRTSKTSPELSEMETCAMGASVIDELDKIRLAHAGGGPAPAGALTAEPIISGDVDDVSRLCNHRAELSLESRAILVARELAARLSQATAAGDGNGERLAASSGPSKRDIGAGRPAGRRPPVKCLPQPNAFQPCRDLFDSIWLRASIWLVFLFAFAGNILVIVVLSSVRPSSSTSALTSIMWFNAAQSKRHIDVPRFLVINLAVADLLMALYLGLLAFIDASTLGEFRRHAIKWQYSTGCQMAGFLGVLSSELSVFILAVITLERNYAITNAVHLNRRLSLQKAIVIMFLGYVYALTMAILPLNGRINDYRKFGICLPLDFDANNLQSSSSLYLISLISINTLSFVLLLGCYLRMYCAIRGSQAWSTNDLKIAKRMSILVVTDFLCWSPIILVASLALCGYNLVGSEGLKVLVIFVLPLNSVANPFLYAITTKKFKRDLASLRKRLKLERSLGIMTRFLQTGGCLRRDSPTSQHGNRSLSGAAKYRLPGDDHPHQRSQQSRMRRTPTGCRATLDETRAAVSSKIQRARQDLLLVNEGGHSVLGRGLHSADQVQRRIQFGSSAIGQLAEAARGACQQSVDVRAIACAVCHSRLTTPNPARGLDSSSSSMELVTRNRLDGSRPKIVLDSVEPVLDVALAPLQLATESPTRRELPQLLTPSRGANRHQSGLCRRTSASEQEIQTNQTRAHIMSEQQVRASSADKNSAEQKFLSPSILSAAYFETGRPERVDVDSPDSHRASNIDRYQQAMATGSCSTVLINQHQHQHQLDLKQSLTSYPKADPDGKRSVSACGDWPASSYTRRAGYGGETDGSHVALTSGIGCSCSSETVQKRGGASLNGNHTASPERRRGLAAISRIHSENTRQQNRSRTRSISRLVIEPLAKAWSSLQLSLQPNQATTTTTTTTLNQQATALRAPSFQVARSTAVTLTNQKQLSADQTFVVHNNDHDEHPESTERDELLVDINESDIIEDVLQMSSPSRRLMFQGRRMSRSCDVIVETSTTSVELTSSSYNDQNDDQRILLATISQLNSRSRKGHTKQMSFDQHKSRHADGHNQQVPERSKGSGRRLSCTRCRSWSPALMDKLDDCMHHIRNKIPGFGNKEGNLIDGTDDRDLGQLSAELRRTDGEALDTPSEQQLQPDGAEDQFFHELLLQPSPSPSSSTSEPVVDEEDEFNEVGLADWTRNMRRRAPQNCYTKSASRRQKLRQQLSGNSDTLSIQTAGTTLTSVSFDSSSNIPITVLGSLKNSVPHLVSSSASSSASGCNTNERSTKSRTSNDEH